MKPAFAGYLLNIVAFVRRRRVRYVRASSRVRGVDPEVLDGRAPPGGATAWALRKGYMVESSSRALAGNGREKHHEMDVPVVDDRARSKGTAP